MIVGSASAHQDAIGVETTLHGIIFGPRQLEEDGPVQQPHRFEEDLTKGINPIRPPSRSRIRRCVARRAVRTGGTRP
jgi:hypothetical protein